MSLQLIEVRTDKPKYCYKYEEVVSLLPQQYKGLLARDKEGLTTTTQLLFNWIMGQGRNHLDMATFNVFQFIYWRTYVYFKRAELISTSQFLKGVCNSKDGEYLCAATTSSTHTLYKALGVLRDMHLLNHYRIKVNGTDVISCFEINVKTVLALQVKGEDMSKLRESRKSKAGVFDFPTGEKSLFSGQSTVVHKCGDGVVHMCSTKDTKETKDTKSISRSVPRNAAEVTTAIQQTIDKAVAISTAKRITRVRRAAVGVTISLTDLNATWKQAMIEAYGSCTIVGLTTKEYGIFKRACKAHELNCSWKVFFDWAISHWAVINKEFRDYKEYKRKRGEGKIGEKDDVLFLGTERPDLFMTVKNFGRLLKRYSQHSLAGKSATVEDSPEVAVLKEELVKTRRSLQTHKDLLTRVAKSIPAAPATPVRQRPPVRVVDPKGDTFFAETDTELPEWR